MSVTIKTKYILALGCVLVLVLIILGYVIGHRAGDRVVEEARLSQGNIINTYQVMLNDTRKYVTQQRQEILTLKEAKKQGDLTNEELKKLNLKQLNEITRLKLRIDTLLQNVTHNGTIIDVLTSQIVECQTSNDTITKQKAILLPFSFQKKDEFLSLSGTFNNIGKLDISLKLDTKLDIYVGLKKKTKEYTCIVTSDNTYLGVIDIRSQKFDLQKDKKFGIGVQVGYGGLISDGALRLGLYTGVGIDWNIIRF